MTKALHVTAAVAALLSAAAAGFVAARYWGTAPTPAAAGAEREVLYWYDPMKPAEHFDRPGLSPMGMEMVPKYADEVSASGVRISPDTVQSLGIRTMAVTVGRLTHDVVVPASIDWNPEEAVAVSARAGGIITGLRKRAPFTPVASGEVLATLISPDWNSAAQEYLALGHASTDDAKALRDAARQRLRALGMTEAQIAALRGGAAGIAIRAPATGVLSAINAREGEQVAGGTQLATINSLRHVWVEASIPQAQLAGIGVGTPAVITTTALPGRSFPATVRLLLPEVDAVTRAVRARLVVDNPDGALLPGMFAQVAIKGPEGEPLPLVPDEAIIATGTATRVIVARGDGRFEPVAVTTGASANGLTAIASGLEGGEKLVVSGQFLIDSEANLSGALDRLGRDAHHGHAMPGMANMAAQP